MSAPEKSGAMVHSNGPAPDCTYVGGSAVKYAACAPEAVPSAPMIVAAVTAASRIRPPPMRPPRVAPARRFLGRLDAWTTLVAKAAPAVGPGGCARSPG